MTHLLPDHGVILVVGIVGVPQLACRGQGHAHTHHTHYHVGIDLVHYIDSPR